MSFRSCIFFLVGTLLCRGASSPTWPIGSAATTFPPQTKCLVQVFGHEDSMTEVAISRLREFFPGLVDVLHAPATYDPLNYELIIKLGIHGSDPSLDPLWGNFKTNDSDTFLIRTISRSPQTVAISGRSSRGTMFAAYRLAELIETRADLSALDITQVPAVQRRYAALSAASAGGAYYRHLLYLKQLRELPRYGINGVTILGYTSMNTPAGDDGPPFMIHRDGIQPVPVKLEEWRLLLREIKRYGLDAVLIVPPYFPGRYQADDIVQHYSGEKPIPGYNEQLAAFFPEYLRLCTQHLPELDGFILLNWEYPGNIGAQMFTIQSRIEKYRYGPRDAQRSTAALEVYLQALENFGREHRKVTGFIVHNAGLRWNELHAMHDVLARHPTVIKIEPPYFTDNGWGQMPIFGFLPPGMDKEKILGQGALGVYMTTTNGQYYGGGTLPTAYPDPFVAASAEAVRQRAELVMMMIGVWGASTPGDLFDIDEILPLAASARLWSDWPGLDEIWSRWTSRRFGPVAGPILLPALRSSATIIRDGMTVGGVDLMTHTALRAESWRPPNVRFALFGKPGSPVLPSSTNGYSNPSNTVAFQNNLRALPLADFQANQRRALAAAVAGAQAVETSRPYLSVSDYEYLRRIFADSQVILRAIKLIGDADHAAHLAIDNYANVTHPAEDFTRALLALERYADEIRDFRTTPAELAEKSSSGLIIHPPLSGTLRKIAEDLRAYVAMSPIERQQRIDRWAP